MFKGAACNGFGGKWMRKCTDLGMYLIAHQCFFSKNVFRAVWAIGSTSDWIDGMPIRTSRVPRNTSNFAAASFNAGFIDAMPVDTGVLFCCLRKIVQPFVITEGSFPIADRLGLFLWMIGDKL